MRCAASIRNDSVEAHLRGAPEKQMWGGEGLRQEPREPRADSLQTGAGQVKEGQSEHQGPPSQGLS